MEMNDLRTKTLAAFAISVLADKYLIGETNMNRSLMYGAALATSVYFENTIVGAIETQVPQIKSHFTNEKQAVERALELGTVAVSTHLLNGYLLNNEQSQGSSEYWVRMGISAGSDWAANKVVQYVNGEPMSIM